MLTPKNEKDGGTSAVLVGIRVSQRGPARASRDLAPATAGFYTNGIKSYGRAPTFLRLTGYEQARSVAAALAGDLAAADDVHLALPDTGICVTDFEARDCCGGPAPARAETCYVADALAKEAGQKGCGCGAAACPLMRPQEPFLAPRLLVPAIGITQILLAIVAGVSR